MNQVLLRIILLVILPALGGGGYFVYWKKHATPADASFLAKTAALPSKLLAQVRSSSGSDDRGDHSSNRRGLRVTALLYSKNRAMAQINEACLGVGEESSIRLAKQTVKLRCLKIDAASVTVQIDDAEPDVLTIN